MSFAVVPIKTDLEIKQEKERELYKFGKRVRSKVVLTEDSYDEGIRQIVRRDYFPDLGRLERRHELEQAIEEQDTEKIREIQAKMLASERRATPATKAAMTPLNFVPTKEVDEMANKPTPLAVLETVDGGKAEIAQDIRLNAFCSTFDSEDGDNFEKVLDKQWRQKRQKNLILQEELLKEKEGKNIAGLLTYNYNSKNALFFSPEQKLLTDGKNNPKENSTRNSISFTNTRFTKAELEQTKEKEKEHNKDNLMNWGEVDSESRKRIPTGKVVLNEDFKTPAFFKGPHTPYLDSYSQNKNAIIPPPSPAPGDSPFVTWGQIGSAQIVTEQLETPLDTTSKYVYEQPKLSKRDQVAQMLAQKASKSLRMKAQRTPYSRTGTPSPLLERLRSGRVLTPCGSTPSLLSTLQRQRHDPSPMDDFRRHNSIGGTFSLKVDQGKK